VREIVRERAGWFRSRGALYHYSKNGAKLLAELLNRDGVEVPDRFR